MLKINKPQLYLSLIVAAIIATGSATALAAKGSDGGSSGSGSSSTSASTETEANDTNKTETEANDQPGVHEANETGEVSSTAELHHRGDNLLAEAKKNHADDKNKTDAQRQKVCENHKQGISNKFNHIVTNSQKIQKRIDDIYAKALAFQQSNGTTPDGFADLTAAADTAKANAAASITALQAITPTIDCNNTSVASDIATFKAAAQQTRDNLKAYRTSVKAVLKALETVKTEANEGSN